MQLLLATRKRVTTHAFLREEGGPLAVEGVNKNSLSLAYARQLPQEGALMLADARVILSLPLRVAKRREGLE